MAKAITVVHGSHKGYGLLMENEVIAGAPDGILVCEKDLKINHDKLELAIEKYKQRIQNGNKNKRKRNENVEKGTSQSAYL